MFNALEGALSWLHTRQAGVPDALQVTVFDAVRQVGHGQDTPEAVLRVAADRLLEATLQSDEPTDPVTLLAADALITYVCEYRSEFEPDELDSVL